MSGKSIENIDAFGKPMPGFNLRGRSVVNSRTGGVITVFYLCLMLVYGYFKFIKLWQKLDP